MTKSKITLGTDPEVFLFSEETNHFFPSQGITKGTKEEPYTIPSLGEGFSTQVDNVMTEFNIPASSSPEEFSQNIQKVLDWIQNNLPKELVVKIQPSAEFTEDMLNSDVAQLLGCSADFDAYSGENVSVTSLAHTLERYAGGHIHIGYPSPNVDKNEKIVKWMDIYTGLPSVFLDEDDKRKKYYGTPGRYREKSFGVEYRTLSNWWIKTPKLREWIFKQAEKAYYAVENNIIIGESFERSVQDAISTNNRESAMILMTHFDVIKPEELAELLITTNKKENVIIN